jgi:hypothetical protein
MAKPVFAESWDVALDKSVTAAKNFFDEAHHPRIEKALDIVLDGRIMFLRDGTVIVESDESTSSEAKTYTVTKGYCDCPDAKHRGPWCKHALARALMIKASKVNTKKEETPPPSSKWERVTS